MDKKSLIWKVILITSLLTPICKNLMYPWNIFVVTIGILALVIYVIKDRKKYNKFNFTGMFCAIVGFIIGVMMIMGNLNGISLFIQIIASLGMVFLGVVLIGVGNHISNPEKVSKKMIYISIAFFSGILGVYWILFNL